MENKENNFEFNNPAPAPIPEPLPELRVNRRGGGFSGAANRFCSDANPSPVKSTVPAYALGNSEKKESKPDINENKDIQGGEVDSSAVNTALTQAVPQMQTATSLDSHFSREMPCQNTAPAANVNNTIGKYNVPADKKKASTGLVVFISVISTVMVMLAVFFVYILLDRDGSSKSGILDGILPTESSTETDGEEDLPDYKEFFNQQDSTKADDSNTKQKENTKSYVDKSWKGIKLLDQPSEKKKNTVQKNYEIISDSTVSVLCFTDKIKDADSADSQGTGTILSSDGYIVTNSHVIGDSKSLYKYQVIDSNSKKYTAYVVGYDTRTDIAVLKIDAKNLKVASFGKTDKLKVGDDIISVGDSGGIGFRDSLTKGIVSGKNRSLSKSNIDYIQIDAAVNPGNSGGPISNMYGQVVGITTIKINSVSYEGMGFAIPSETIKLIADDIIRQGYVDNRVQIGITGIAVDEYSAEIYNIPQGIAISEISQSGSLANTTVKQGDIITEFDGEEVTTFDKVYSLLEGHKPGDKVKIKLYRVDDNNPKKGKYFTVTVTLVADKGESQK